MLSKNVADALSGRCDGATAQEKFTVERQDELGAERRQTELDIGEHFGNVGTFSGEVAESPRAQNAVGM